MSPEEQEKFNALMIKLFENDPQIQEQVKEIAKEGFKKLLLDGNPEAHRLMNDYLNRQDFMRGKKTD